MIYQEERKEKKATKKEYYSVVESFKKKLKDNESFLVTIHGESYVGKTCLSMRLLSICVEFGYQCFYTQNTNNTTIAKLKEFFNQQEKGSFIALCLENAAVAYYAIPEMLKNLDDTVKLVIICTSLEPVHQTKKHNLQDMETEWEDYAITEKISYEVGTDIFRKLKSENHLGRLQSEHTKDTDIKRTIRQCKDFINALWYAHDGRYFIDHFNDWYNQHADEGQIKLFNFLTFYASIGCLSFSLAFIPDLARNLRIKNFSYPDFKKSFNEFWIEKNGFIRLRYVRLFTNIVDTRISANEKVECIKVMMTLLSKRTYERDHSQYNLMFETVAKIKNLENYSNLDKEIIKNIFEEVENECQHLSYYWIQRCIIYSQCEMFEEASNAISNAKGKRQYLTYQIIHADAKNDMARGLWCLKNKKSESERYFEQGRKKMRTLIDNKDKYRNAFSFSVHAYVNMSINYYVLLKKTPDPIEWMYIQKIMWELIEQISFSDKIIADLVDRFVRYATDLGYLNNVKGMKNRLSKKRKRSGDLSDYEIDEIPS